MFIRARSRVGQNIPSKKGLTPSWVNLSFGRLPLTFSPEALQVVWT